MKNFIVILFMTGCLQVSGAGQKVPKATPSGLEPKEKVEDRRITFRYTVVADTSDVQKYVNEGLKEGKDYRSIVILMEDTAFSLENLKTLFALLSRRYSDRTGLYARVFTSLDAIPTPEEYDKMSLYGPLENYRKYKNAYFSRDARGNFITYEIPGVIGPKEVFLGLTDSKGQ